MREQAQIIRWEEPPPARSHGARPAGRSTSRWDAVAEELRARPGRAAVIAEAGGRQLLDLAWRINRGVMVPFSPRGTFKAETRENAGIVTVYARYLGDGEGDHA